MKLYNDYNSYLKNRYGCKVYKIGLDAGFSCPTRDGTKGTGGCLYCNAEGSRASYTDPAHTIQEQLTKRMEYLKSKEDATKFIAYFQAFTNTYAPVYKLKTVYDNILPFPEIVGMSIGTRPDAVDAGKFNLIASYKARYDVWLEYGLQSAHDKTLQEINRGHDFKTFVEAVSLAKRFDIPICAHVILGLPGETSEDMIETARKVSSLNIEGVKIHLLHVLKGSHMERLYNEGRLKVLGQDDYAELVCDFLEHLSPDIIIQRLTGEGSRKNHIAPMWTLDKIGTINKIKSTLKKRNSYQGIKSKGLNKKVAIS